LYQIAVKYTTFFHSKALHNTLKLWSLVLKYIIWQSCKFPAGLNTLSREPSHRDWQHGMECQVLSRCFEISWLLKWGGTLKRATFCRSYKIGLTCKSIALSCTTGWVTPFLLSFRKY
jgi:hypothetical protein